MSAYLHERTYEYCRQILTLNYDTIRLAFFSQEYVLRNVCMQILYKYEKTHMKFVLKILGNERIVRMTKLNL